jgi:hypothetical protein
MSQVRKGIVPPACTIRGAFIFPIYTNPLPFHTPHAFEALQGGFQSMMRQPPGGIHGAEV